MAEGTQRPRSMNRVAVATKVTEGSGSEIGKKETHFANTHDIIREQKLKHAAKVEREKKYASERKAPSTNKDTGETIYFDAFMDAPKLRKEKTTTKKTDSVKSKVNTGIRSRIQNESSDPVQKSDITNGASNDEQKQASSPDEIPTKAPTEKKAPRKNKDTGETIYYNVFTDAPSLRKQKTAPKKNEGIKSRIDTGLKGKNDASDEKSKENGDSTSADAATGGKGETKALALEKLIKKAGVEEKFKDYKTEKNPSDAASSKNVRGARTQSAKSKGSKFTLESNLQTSKPSGKTELDSKKDPNSKTSKAQNSITNQKRKEILAGKSSAESKEAQKAKVCDNEVKLWLETLKLKEAQKYIDLFAEQEINMDSVVLLTRHQLRQMGVTAFGPLNSITSAIDILIKEKENEAKKLALSKAVPKTKKNVTKVRKASPSKEVDNVASERNNESQEDVTPKMNDTKGKKSVSSLGTAKGKPKKPSSAVNKGEMIAIFSRLGH